MTGEIVDPVNFIHVGFSNFIFDPGRVILCRPFESIESWAWLHLVCYCPNLTMSVSLQARRVKVEGWPKQLPFTRPINLKKVKQKKSTALQQVTIQEVNGESLDGDWGGLRKLNQRYWNHPKESLARQILYFNWFRQSVQDPLVPQMDQPIEKEEATLVQI